MALCHLNVDPHSAAVAYINATLDLSLCGVVQNCTDVNQTEANMTDLSKVKSSCYCGAVLLEYSVEGDNFITSVRAQARI